MKSNSHHHHYSDKPLKKKINYYSDKLLVIQLRLKLKTTHSSFKVMNLDAENVADVVIGVILKLGKWNRAIRFMVVHMVHILRWY